ncbi:hypothetical protein [Streptomyces sp. NPDC037389]|uniref:hypothetical protein n=1 Tax=Streptomyces sp. NPDC037389 TaxID=3155369 RepID=UPI00340EE7DA
MPDMHFLALCPEGHYREFAAPAEEVIRIAVVFRSLAPALSLPLTPQITLHCALFGDPLPNPLAQGLSAHYGRPLHRQRGMVLVSGPTDLHGQAQGLTAEARSEVLGALDAIALSGRIPFQRDHRNE